GKLLSRSGLHPRGTGDDLRTRGHTYVHIHVLGEWRARVRTDEHGVRGPLPRSFQRTTHVRCTPTGSQPDGQGSRGKALRVGPTGTPVVLDPLARMCECLAPAGVVGHHPLGGDAIGGW